MRRSQAGESGRRIVDHGAVGMAVVGCRESGIAAGGIAAEVSSAENLVQVLLKSSNCFEAMEAYLLRIVLALLLVLRLAITLLGRVAALLLAVAALRLLMTATAVVILVGHCRGY